MFDFSADFQQARYHIAIQIAAASAIIFIWLCLRMPEGNLLIAVFTFLSAVRISDTASLKVRFKLLAGMMIATSILQYIISATYNIHLLNILLPPAAGYFILRTMPPASAYPVLLTGFMTYSVQPGAYAAAQRIIDIIIAGSAAWVITWAATLHIRFQQTGSSGKPLPPGEVFIETLTIFCAVLLYRILAMPQGIWIVLTIIFIYIARQPGQPSSELVRQRIFSVPLGILLGGIYSASAAALDYRLAYLAPLIGAAGFFALYSRHNFFMFSLLFMTSFTVCADWLAGTFREFNFWQFLFTHSLATFIGTAVLLFIEKSVAIQNQQRQTV